MAGIDRIINEILEDANSRAAEILDQARKDADEEIAAAEAEAKEASEAADRRAERAVSDYEGRVRSQCEQENKLALLAAKQEVIDRVLEKAGKRLEEQEPQAYFDMLLKLLAQVVRPGDGELALSAADLARVPADFCGRAEEIARSAGGTVSLAKEPADIASGFVLRYGQIEENCSLAALFAEKRDSLQDRITSIVW